MASKRSSGRSNGFLALFAAVLVAASATACCRGSSSSSSSGSGSGTGIGSPTAFNVGDSVDVEWNGGWWQARILSVNGGLYRIHYVGWGNNWDESVPARRVRASTGTAKKGSGPN